MLNGRILLQLHNNWTSIPLDTSCKYIYHYTSKYGLDGILGGKKLWANDIYRQNDKSEGIYVIELLEENINSLCENPDFAKAILKQCSLLKPKLVDGFYNSNKYRSFITSFSTECDELALWNYYTKDINNSGYNITFNLNKLISPCLQTTKRKKDDGNNIIQYIDSINYHHGKVIYDISSQISILKEIVESFSPYYSTSEDDCEYLVVDKILWVGQFFKSPYFKHESEYRFAFFTYTDKSMPTADKMPIEYEGNTKNHIDIFFNTAAIEAVTCSPTNTQTNIDYPKQYCTDIFPNFKSVNESNVPFRIM
jgi:hypothetical protein